MKILIISLVFPYPIDAGGSAGTFKMIDYSRKNHDITFLSITSSPENEKTLRDLWPNVKIKTAQSLADQIKPSSLRKVFNILKGNKDNVVHNPNNMVLYGTDLDKCYFPDLINLVIETCEKEKFDLIQTEFIDIAPIIHFLPKETPKIHIHHELRFRRMQLEYDLLEEKNVADQWHIQGTKTLEIETLRKYDKVLTVSEKDAVILIENGLPLDKVACSQLPIEQKEHDVNQPFVFKNRLIYLGPESHYPNYDGVKWFLSEIWPTIFKNNPTLEFWVIGKWSDKSKASLKDFPNVYFKGFVEDLSSVFDGSIMVVPLRIGGGMRMKLLEGFSYHVPIITSQQGAEGLPMQDQHNCLLPQNEKEWINAIQTLLNNPKLQEQLITNTNGIVGDQFSLEKCGELREDLYRKVVS